MTGIGGRVWGAALGLGLCLGVAGSPAHAQEGTAPFARVALDPGEVVTVGQPLTLRLEILAPSFFTGAPHFPDVSLPDALVLFVPRGSNFSERIDGTTWAGQRRSYIVYPQRPGSFEISEIPIQVRYSEPNTRDRVTGTASPPPVSFEAVLPPEAEGLDYFISAFGLELEETLDPPPDTLLVGEAVTRTVTATVSGALSMVIPPMVEDTPFGLTAYPALPQVSDEDGGGIETTVGQRVESVTYVAEQEGDHTLPGVVLQWWDVKAQELRTASVPSVEVHVAPNPDLVPEIPLPEDSTVVADAVGGETGPGRPSFRDLLRRWGVPLALVLLGMIILGWTQRRFGGVLADRIAAARSRWAESEARSFQLVRKAARSGDARATARQLMKWIDRWTAGGRQATAAESLGAEADPEVRQQLLALDAALYGSKADGSEVRWSGKDFAKTVARARRRRGHTSSRRQSARRLRPLNPRK